MSFQDVYNATYDVINFSDKIADDKRLNRKVKSVPGHFIILGEDSIRELNKEKKLEKYKDDWKRMFRSFKEAVKLAKEDISSRRLMLFNGNNFYKVFPCFTHFQFVMTHRNEYDMYVYQRSSDLAKLKDDCVFFTKVAKKFEKKVGIKVTKIVIVFGDVHFEVKE